MPRVGRPNMRKKDKRVALTAMVSLENRRWVDSHPEGRKVVERLIEAARARESEYVHKPF